MFTFFSYRAINFTNIDGAGAKLFLVKLKKLHEYLQNEIYKTKYLT